MTREEAIQIIHNIYQTDKEKLALEFLIPELAESEDERIRRKMIEHFKAKTKETWCNMPVKDIVAYLEKLKENPKSADSIPSDYTSDVKCEDRWHKVTDSLPDSKRLVLAKDSFGNVLLTRYDGSWMVNVYDSEDYYTHNSITEWCDIPKDTHCAYLRGLIGWSDEDERMRQTAIEACKVVINDYENSNSRFYKCKDWLENKLVEKF